MNKLIDNYKNFISTCKTERECVNYSISQLENAGFHSLQNNEDISKCYVSKMGKAIGAFYIKEPLEYGINILCAHIDSPRLDVKQNPLFLDGKLNFLNTHYYGGIKKYQWVTTPLAIHGVVCKKDGTKIEVVCGEDESDPVFCISDLLPHLAQDQMQKKAFEFINGEELDLIIGLDTDDEKEKSKEKEDSKKAILKVIKDKYSFDENDFQSAELEIVPAGKARDLGFDRKMILGYGQDDRSCTYASLTAFIDQVNEGKLSKNACVLLVDKEEIGSVGATGLDSNLFENMVSDLMYATNKSYSDHDLRKCLENSYMLSSDVNAAFDPHHANVFDKDNTCYLGHGASFNKFTGSGGKSGSNDANPEYIAKLRNILEGKYKYQMCELGKVGKGGGGTIAYLAARYGMQVIDMGVPLLCMHAPWEVVAKDDIESAYGIYREFLKELK